MNRERTSMEIGFVDFQQVVDSWGSWSNGGHHASWDHQCRDRCTGMTHCDLFNERSFWQLSSSLRLPLNLHSLPLTFKWAGCLDKQESYLRVEDCRRPSDQVGFCSNIIQWDRLHNCACIILIHQVWHPRHTCENRDREPWCEWTKTHGMPTRNSKNQLERL